MVASCSSKMGMSFRIGYTLLHSLHFKLSSPRRTNGLRQTGQARISRRSGSIMLPIVTSVEGVSRLAEYAECVRIVTKRDDESGGKRVYS